MRFIKEGSSRRSIMVFRILLIIAGMLVLVIMAGTIYGLAKRGKSAVPPLFPAEISGAESIFSNLGTMRIPTADPDPETLVISIAFPYSKSDRPFSEELASRISWFKTVTTDYLGAFTGEELSAMDESTINNELLSRFNSDLRLGQIKELYILEFMRL